MTLPATVVDEIRRLLAVGDLSQRGIARRVGVSRGSVNAIALGKRPDPQMPPCPQNPEGTFVAPAGPPARCPTCGGMVRMPCLACTLRAFRQTRRQPLRAIRPLAGHKAAGAVSHPNVDR